MPGLSAAVLGEMDLKVVLDSVVESARRLTGARYAALCVLNDARDGLARFVTAGSTMTAMRRSASCRAAAACSAI